MACVAESFTHSDVLVYRYQPLSHDQIRLIEIQPGTYSDPIIINIVHAPAPSSRTSRDTSSYEALSYSWGAPIFDRVIACSSEPASILRITASLESALRRLRFENRIRIIWADAICINQYDVDERNHQVQQMATIYEYAARTLVYLGEGDDVSNRAMDIVSDVHETLTDGAFWSSSAPCSVLQLFERPWFARVWVIQEVARSQTAVVISGTKAVSWDCFNRWPARHNNIRLESGKALPPPPGILSYSSGFTPSLEGLLKLLHETRQSLASDPRDKVIGLLGLISGGSEWMALADYSLSVKDIYTRTAELILAKSNSLQCLSAVLSRSKIPNLPSWVPDWSDRSAIKPLAVGDTYNLSYNAGGASANIKFDRHRYSISTMGVSIGVAWTMSRSEAAELAHAIANPHKLALRPVFRIGGLNALFQSARYGIVTGARRPPTLMQWRSNLHDVLTAKPPAAVAALEAQDQSNKDLDLEEILMNSLIDRVLDKLIVNAPLDPGLAHTARSTSSYRIFVRRFEEVMFGRTLFATSDGRVGLGPEHIGLGDVAAVLLGGPVPYVLRPNSDGMFRLVGEAYVQGAMNCEALHHVRDELKASELSIPPTNPESICCSSALEWFSIE